MQTVQAQVLSALFLQHDDQNMTTKTCRPYNLLIQFTCKYIVQGLHTHTHLAGYAVHHQSLVASCVAVAQERRHGRIDVCGLLLAGAHH
eukprot:COSAG02_NODE_46_length_45443_cov_36.731497_27_plen_89_part_00